jgi:hypothetical protein
VLTYTGSGFEYNGVALIQTSGSGTLVLDSGDPACTISGGSTFTFPPVTMLRGWPWVAAGCLLCFISGCPHSANGSACVEGWVAPACMHQEPSRPSAQGLDIYTSAS